MNADGHARPGRWQPGEPFPALHKELDADDGELTRTNKVRRGFIAEKYAARWTPCTQAAPSSTSRPR